MNKVLTIILHHYTALFYNTLKYKYTHNFVQQICMSVITEQLCSMIQRQCDHMIKLLGHVSLTM